MHCMFSVYGDVIIFVHKWKGLNLHQKMERKKIPVLYQYMRILKLFYQSLRKYTGLDETQWYRHTSIAHWNTRHIPLALFNEHPKYQTSNHRDYLQKDRKSHQQGVQLPLQRSQVYVCVSYKKK